MIWLPVLGGIAALIGGAAVGGALAGIFAAAHLHGAIFVLALIAGLFVASFVSIFFQTGVVFAATERLEGGTPSVKGCLAKSWGRRRVIAPWALLSTAVGLIIQAIEDRASWAAKIIGVLGGAAWAVATFFVLPVLAFENVGPFKAVERSASLMKQRFGTVVRTSVRFGLAYVGWFFLSLAVLVGGIFLTAAFGPAFLVVAFAGGVGLAVVLMLTAVIGLYTRTILYRYANNQPIPGIDLDLASVFTAPARRGR